MVDSSCAITMTTSQGCLYLRQDTVLPGLKAVSTIYEGSRMFPDSRRNYSKKLNFRNVEGSTKHGRISHHGIPFEVNDSDWSVEAAAAKKWRQQLCFRYGIGLGRRGLRCSPWRSSGSSQEKVLESSGLIFNVDGLTGKILRLRVALTDAAISPAWAVSWKWILSVALAVSINFLPWSIDVATAQGEFEGSGCDDVSQYYSQASDLKGEQLKAKLHEIVAGHKRLSYAQVWNALKILDAADTESPDTSPDIVDIYSLKRLPKSLQGSSEGWNREHLWPRSYGLAENRPEFTDVHNLRPADVNAGINSDVVIPQCPPLYVSIVNSSRGNKYFGDCTALKTLRCLIPANREAAADTATDANSWRPPSKVRGDIARAVFYMAVRYGIEQPSGSLNLQISDSPSVEKATMGLLSTLLQWNNLDPPSPSEVLRNTRVCSLYQGNRNPFVDHPEYASSIWGAPDITPGPTIPGESNPEIENQLPNAWINEIHYNNIGQDQNEFIEVVVGSNVKISSLNVYLYDSEGTVYRTFPIADPTLFQMSNIYGSDSVIYSAALPGGSLQNGPADGIALVQEQSAENSKVLQFLSYQGVLTATEGPAKGLISKDMGVREGENFPVGGSLGLSGSGQKYEDFVWTEFIRAASPGSVNSGQLIS